MARGRARTGVRRNSIRKKKTPTDPGRNKVASELLSALRILSGMKTRVAELADTLGINDRSAYRILTVLRFQGLPLRAERRGREVKYWLEREQVAKWLAGDASAREVVS